MYVHIISKILYFLVHVFVAEDNWPKTARFFKRFKFFRMKSDPSRDTEKRNSWFSREPSKR